MADIKINDLVAYTDPVSTDVLPIVDVGNDLTKKVSIADLLENAGTGSAAAPSFSFDGDNDTGAYRPAENQIALTTAGTERLRIDSSGRVGIGSISPVFKFHSNETGGSSIAGLFQTNQTESFVSFAASGTTSTSTVRLGATANNLIAFVNGGERLRIDSSGRVGVGTSSPHSIIHANSSGATPAYFQSTNASSGSGAGDGVVMGLGSAADVYYWNYESGPQVWATSGTERMRIDSSGRLMVGTTTEGSVNADNLTLSESGNCGLTIRSATTGSGNIYFSDATSGIAEYSGAVLYDHNDNRMMLYTASSERLRIDSSGNVFIGGTTASSADIALNANGSITAAGDITVGANPGDGSGSQGSYINAAGQFTAAIPSGFDVFTGRTAGNPAITSSIGADGSITAASKLDIGAGWDAGASNTGGSRITSGSYFSQLPSTAGTTNVFTAVKGTDVNYQLKADGSITAAGTATFGPYNPSSSYTEAGVCVMGRCDCNHCRRKLLYITASTFKRLARPICGKCINWHCNF